MTRKQAPQTTVGHVSLISRLVAYAAELADLRTDATESEQRIAELVIENGQLKTELAGHSARLQNRACRRKQLGPFNDNDDDAGRVYLSTILAVCGYLITVAGVAANHTWIVAAAIPLLLASLAVGSQETDTAE